MRQLFRNPPWVHPQEPEIIASVFRERGERRKLRKGYVFRHGGEDGEVAYIEKGLVFFVFSGQTDKTHIFAIVPKGGVVGDLDALTQESLNLDAEVARTTEALFLPGKVYREAILSSTERLHAYATGSIIKEEIQMEGLIANFTLPLEERLIAFMSAVISAHYPIKADGWNPLPITFTTFEISNTIASNRSSISTIITRWSHKGLAKRDGHRLMLHGKLFLTDYDWIQTAAPSPALPQP